uniref:DUF4283 domain-containing protein n=1 Tax=Tanacetum cinerariifolium TaxID=118510 RepID=A0A6L2LA34_TANCI|nr:hypothetical protein [Tanacetum cinerariifolium]
MKEKGAGFILFWVKGSFDFAAAIVFSKPYSFCPCCLIGVIGGVSCASIPYLFCFVFVGMERGFLDSGDKKKKKDGDGVKKDAMDEAANVGIAVKTDYDKGESRNGGKNTPTKVRFGPITTSTVAIPGDAEGSSNGGTCEARTDCSFASLVRPKESSTKAVASKVKIRYENSIVGFFFGKNPLFPVVKQYALNTWRKFGFEKITRNDDGVYLFKFASKSGMDQVLEKGPWLIRKSPIILNKWTPSVSLKKGEVANVPVWVKMYNVPVLAYSEDGLSLIATQIGKLIMLDAFTSSMCVESWGRICFARALIEVSASSALKKEIIMAVPEDEGDGYVKEVIRIKYEWKLPHCVDCQSFGHDSKLCPKRVREEVPNNSARVTKATTMEENNDAIAWLGFIKSSKNLNKGESGVGSFDVDNLYSHDTTDDEDVFNSYGDSFGGGNQLEDEDFDFYEGYADQVVDLDGALKEFRDFKLSMSGRK